ncbi:hypothetical protein GOODEAATRI_006615, partial [Goodea atripinnis]
MRSDCASLSFPEGLASATSLCLAPPTSLPGASLSFPEGLASATSLCLAPPTSLP